MPVLSSDTLFHFTNSLENLVSILIHEFRPRLSVESFRHILAHMPELQHMPESGIPMVCFCDIPLSQVAQHMDDYGDYGIGLTKPWGIARGISPVTYVHEQSVAARSAAHAIQILRTMNSTGISDEDKQKALSAGQFIYLFKPYEGALERPGKAPRNVRFYNEREWRYLPRELESIPPIAPSVLADPLASAPIRRMVDQLPSLSFEPADINYIVVRHESELLPMYYALRQIKQKYNEATIDLLVTKLVSAERIRADF